MTTRVLLQQIFNYLKNEYDVSDWWRNESALEICVGAILVQNTTWRQAHVALKQLITTGNLEINEIKKLDILILQKLIKPSGFIKSGHILVFSHAHKAPARAAIAAPIAKLAAF